MVYKNKNTPSVNDRLSTVAMQVGLFLMTAAATLGMIELPEHSNKVAVLSQPVFATSSIDNYAEQPNPLRREREETAAHYVSYSTIQRTPGRTGRF